SPSVSPRAQAATWLRLAGRSGRVKGPVPDRCAGGTSMRIAPHVTRAAHMAATVLPLTLLAAACTAAPPARGPGTPSAQSGAASARPAVPPARPALTGAHPCRDLPRFTCSYLTVPLDRSGKVTGT